jgi:Domain of unknown function (4846)
MRNFLTATIFIFIACNNGQINLPKQKETPVATNNTTVAHFASIAQIPVPLGFVRITDSAFGLFSRGISIKQDNTVYLFNGSKKRNQSAQFAVLNISVGDKDLQQCADAVMRLRAEYLFARQQFNDIVFFSGEGFHFSFADWTTGTRYQVVNSKMTTKHLDTDKPCASHACLLEFLEVVFNWCGTASLEKQLTHKSINDIAPGDVLIKGGYPGHAVTVIDVVVNETTGKKMYMLSQSYMPAQDIHILKNPSSEESSPWYEVNDGNIFTPEWTFNANQLYTF